MDKNYSKGQRLFVEVMGATVEGVFHSIDPDHNKLTLRKVILHPSGREMDGIFHYYRNEVLNIRVLEPGSYTGVNEENEAAGKWNLMRKVSATGPVSESSGKITSANVVMNAIPGFGSACSNRRNRLTDEEYDRLSNLIKGHVLVERMGQVFRQAVKDIRAEPIIGVDVQGAFYGRQGKVILVSIATSTRAFIFDVQTLGQESFDQGLRDILESEKIKKVIHNSRLISDCLFHKHHVTLTCVFDTQAGDLMVTRHKYGQFPRCVRSLPQVLSKYLQLPDNFLYYPQIRDGHVKAELEKWSKRPLPLELEAAAVKNCVFLMYLHEKILEEYMSPLENCIDIFLNVVRDAEELEGSEHQATDKLVPLELLSLNKQSKKLGAERKFLDLEPESSIY